MCGIAGFVGEGDQGDLERMTRCLAHRGTGRRGRFTSRSRAGFISAIAGFRSSTLRAAHSRCRLADGGCVIVFNGEIYNHLELRAQLEELGCVFQSDHSDTEVLLHGYRVWGEEIVHFLNGMWAFALWDARQETAVS